MKKYIDSKLQKMRSAKNAQEGYIDVCSDVMEQYDAGKISSGEALEVIKNCLKNISKIKVLPSALAQLWRNKLTTIATILTVTIVTLLIVITSTIKDAAINKQVTWIKNSGADIVVASPESRDLLSNSYISQDQLRSIQDISGVKQAQGFIFYFSTALGVNNKYITLNIQSYEPSAGFGGPWKLAEGRGLQASGETVLDESLKNDLNAQIGKPLSLAGHTYDVVGFSKDTQALSKQMVFITNEDALMYLRNPYYNYVLVRTEDASKLIPALKNKGYNAMTKQEFLDNTRRYWDREIAPTMDLITLVSISFGFIVLVLLFILTFKTRKREIAIMKSTGASNRKLTMIELTGLGLSTGIGVLLGIATSSVGVLVVNQHTAGLDANLPIGSYLIGAAMTGIILLLSCIPICVYIMKVNPLITQKKLYGITLFSLQE